MNEARITLSLTKTFLAMALLGLALITILQSASAFWFAALYAKTLDDQPLPHLTVLAINGKILWCILSVALITSGCLGLFRSQSEARMVGIYAASTTLLLFLNFFLWVALRLPMLATVRESLI